MARSGAFLVILVILVCSSIVGAVSFVSDRMNVPPGVSRVHIQYIVNVSGNLTASIPSGFNVTNASGQVNISSTNITWRGLVDASVNFTLVSPGNCVENDFTESSLSLNGSSLGSFPFICIPDGKVTDFKVEYGHGTANYIGLGDELVISNRSAVLFNLARVFNLGYLLEPNENPVNVSLFCEYERLPVRTYGHGQVRRGSTKVNMSFFWTSLSSGYWFRIGVLSQDFTARPAGTSYNVSCGNLTYQFNHTRVQAPFTNYSLLVRTESPFSVQDSQDPSDSTKRLYVVQNTEKYTAHELNIVFRQANATSIFDHPRLQPNESLVFRLDNSSSTNVSVFFVPPWFIHSSDPTVLVQSHVFPVSVNLSGHAPNITSTSPASPVSVTAGSTQVFTASKTDIDGDTLISTFTLNASVVQQVTDPIPYGSESFSLVTNSTDAGFTFNLTLNVSDGSNSSFFSWIVTLIPTVSAPVSGGGGGAGGGGGGSAGKPVVSHLIPEFACEPDWDCTPWAPCLAGESKRTCRDRAGCATALRPSEVDSCQDQVSIINITFKPTCTDGIKNQGESGVDCQGPCIAVCPYASSPAQEVPGSSSSGMECGDGVCDESESCSCSSDCGIPSPACPRPVKTALSFLILLLLVVLAILLYRKNRGLDKE